MLCKSKLWSTSAKIDASVVHAGLTIARVQYLTPGRSCPYATPGCIAACLGHSSGHMVTGTVRKAQRNRADALKANTVAYTSKLAQSAIGSLKHALRTNRGKVVASFRFNGTSDFVSTWDNARNTISAWAEKQPRLKVWFYEYSKAWEHYLTRRNETETGGVHITLSRSEHTTPWEILQAFRKGYNIAVTVRLNGRPMPTEWQGRPVIDGDKLHGDARFYDRPGCYVFLRAKGKAKSDKTGFVVDL